MGKRKVGTEDGAGPPARLPRRFAARNDPPSPEAMAGEPEAERIVPGRNRKVQVRRTGGRKLFGKAAKKVFLEWFAATCNIGWAAEKAGFNYKTVLRHRMNDPVFAADCDRAMAQGYARLEAQRLETKRKAEPIGIEGDWDAPEMDEMDPARVDAILRERGRQIANPEMARKQGRRPRVASNAEVRAALEKRLKAFHARERARMGCRDATSAGAPLPLDGGSGEGVAVNSGAVPSESPPPPQPSPIKGEGEEE